MTVSGDPGVSSAGENQRPSRGFSSNASRTPYVTKSARSSSGSATPVTLAPPELHKPNCWKVRFCSRYVKYMDGEQLLIPRGDRGAVCQMPTSASACG